VDLFPVSAALIHALPANVTRAEAVALMARGGLGALLRRLARGPMRSIALVYVPFRIYRVHIATNGRLEVAFFAVDAVSGTLDPYCFDELFEASGLATLETRNHVEARLEEAMTRQRIVDAVRRMLFQTGFFKLRQLSIRAEPARSPDVHVPYWVGFFGTDARARVAVVDAVRRRREGAKVRQLIESWLAA
jgi:hypothetical protein